MFMLFNSNTTGVSCGAGTTDPSGVPEFLSDLYWLRVVRSLAFCVMFCSLWFVFWFFFCFFFFCCCHFSFGHCILCPFSIYGF